MPKPSTIFHISKREITHLIFLSGQKSVGYRVHTGRLDGLDDIEVPTAATGNAIVRALRETALRHPELLPASVRPARHLRRNRARSADA